MIKIALISPFVFLKPDYRFSPHEGLNSLLKSNYKAHLLRRPNLSLLTLASYLDDNYEIDYLDEQYHNISFEKDYDIVAISIMTVNSYRGYEIAEAFKTKGSHIIIGGIHATLLPTEAKQHADTVVVGEGEEAWKQFLLDYKNQKPQPYYYGTGEMNLDTSLLPRYDMIPQNYFDSSLFKKKVYSYQYSRGCPHRCNFCSSSKAYGPKYRTKSSHYFLKGVDQAIQLSQTHPMIFFADDDITIKKQTFKPLLDHLADYKISWIGCADIAISEDDELLRKIAKSGCEGIIMGFESLDLEALKTIDPFKARYLKNYDIAVKKILDHGIPIFASFIVGFDTDTPDTFEKIYQWITHHQVPMSSISILSPLPGTEVYEKLKLEKRLLYDHFWDKCSGAYPLFKPKNLTLEALTEGIYQVMSKINSKNVCKNIRI